MSARRPIASVVAAAIVLGLCLVAGCGGEETSFKDATIVDRLDLKRSEGGYAIGGDPFCEVESQLLNASGEVSGAEDEDKLGLVIASREGNVGVLGVPPFAPDCRDRAKRKLNGLDPVPTQ